MVSWKIIFTEQVRKDAKKLASNGLRPKAERLLNMLKTNSYQSPPPFEKLVGDSSGACSRRINIQHRLVYQVLDDIKTVKIIRMESALQLNRFDDLKHRALEK